MEKWQVVFLLIVLCGLVVGWLLNPLAGLVFIWGAMIAAEVSFSKRSKKRR